MKMREPAALIPWSSDQVFHGGDAFFASLLEGLGSARSTIDLEAYIFEDDELGRRVAEALIAAARRGVRVRVMADGIGSPFWPLRLLRVFQEAGVEAKVYHPVAWAFWSFTRVWRGGVNRFLKVLQKVNRRNHRKTCIVDATVAWVGSMNVSAVHLREQSGPAAWRDTGARIEGPGVAFLLTAFEKAWRQARGLQRGVRRRFFRYLAKERRLHPLVRLNDTRSKRRRYHEDLLERIGFATQRVWITNPYFVPNRRLLGALRFAAWMGKDVRVIVPRKSDVFFMRWVSAAYYESLIQAGVRVFEYLPTILHAKTLLIDDWACVGSTNLNYRSWLHDLEVDVVLTGEEAKRSLERQFIRDQQDSQELSLKALHRRGLPERWAGRLFLLFRWWM